MFNFVKTNLFLKIKRRIFKYINNIDKLRISMITQALAKYLLELPKEIIKGDTNIDLLAEKIRLNLVSPEDNDWEFLIEISNSKKKTFRISFHHQENNTNEGLLRIDYNSGHKNPEIVNEFVPEPLKKYAGYWFENEPHIHLFVESYKDLAWAIPIKDYEAIKTKNIQSSEDYTNAIYEFASQTNIITKFVIQQTIL